ncbi:MAG: transferase spermidine synthase [Burkholderiales bacterium]|nr:transferase spermidine synthase [Burkholderiales bacterium]
MQRIRNSLSRLFLNKPSASELPHLKQLQQLQQQHQGRPFVFDEGNLRLMFFNQKCMQSAMKTDAPEKLICGYTRAMMGFLLAHPAPRHILMIGLGGGSLLKFCYRHLPQCRITVLEIDADVIALRRQFQIPDDDERLSIVQCDAVDYLERQAVQADVILLDGYDVDGLVEELNTPAFYASCRRALSTDGILVANIWGKSKVIAPLLSALRALFANNVWWSRSVDSYNLIVFALKNPALSLTPPPLAQASDLDRQYALQLGALCQRLNTLHTGLNADDIPALTQHLAGMMASDANVPRSYAEWTELVSKV